MDITDRGEGYQRNLSYVYIPRYIPSILTPNQPALLSLTLTLLLATPILTILLILFGAPLTTHTPESILCAAHMAILSATGLIYVHGVDGAVWHEIWGVARPGDGVWGGAMGMGIGGWLGAVPIPLDWYISLFLIPWCWLVG